jgi:hypothetical protein
VYGSPRGVNGGGPFSRPGNKAVTSPLSYGAQDESAQHESAQEESAQYERTMSMSELMLEFRS